MRFREPPPPARELWRSARARPTLSLTHGAVGVWARPERRDATQRNASPAPPFPAHRCSACALDQLFPSCPGCYKFSLPHFCPSFSSERGVWQEWGRAWLGGAGGARASFASSACLSTSSFASSRCLSTSFRCYVASVEKGSYGM
ncbi:uncharacterized protein LOC114020616 isoform X10 [Chelonia mydas]|uniref:uncharacterized protein LOC114020616 isoform X10 n=1 Tax=Chelonia mydas TaxID=8469 RepID=UPI001CA8BCE3|nr:uncharacterized protein LOC114020616 isoform X10 [Chelonia mydas]